MLELYVRPFVCISPFNYVCVHPAPLLLQITKQHDEELAAQKQSLKKMREVGEDANYVFHNLFVTHVTANVWTVCFHYFAISSWFRSRNKRAKSPCVQQQSSLSWRKRKVGEHVNEWFWRKKLLTCSSCVIHEITCPLIHAHRIRQDGGLHVLLSPPLHPSAPYCIGERRNKHRTHQEKKHFELITIVQQWHGPVNVDITTVTTTTTAAETPLMTR